MSCREVAGVAAVYEWSGGECLFATMTRRYKDPMARFDKILGPITDDDDSCADASVSFLGPSLTTMIIFDGIFDCLAAC